MIFSNSIENISKAMNAVQSELMPLKKNTYNPITKSNYTPLDEITQSLLKLTTKNGLVVTQYPVTEADKLNMIGIETLLIHSSGEYIHYEPYFMDIGDNKRMTAAQEAGSTITYAKRYALSAIFGIVSDEDKDGNTSQQERPVNKTNMITQKQLGTIKTLCKKFATIAKADELEVREAALQHVEGSSLESLTTAKASELIDYMNNQITKKEKVDRSA